MFIRVSEIEPCRISNIGYWLRRNHNRCRQEPAFRTDLDPRRAPCCRIRYTTLTSVSWPGGRESRGTGDAATILTSVLFLPSAVVTFASATYHCRLKKRSSAALSIRNLYAWGSTVRLGYATPFTRGVSINASPTADGFGVPGIVGGSPG